MYIYVCILYIPASFRTITFIPKDARRNPKDMSTLPNVKGHPDRMITANSLGWIRDFSMGGGVNSILTVVPSTPRAGSKLPSKTVAYFMRFGERSEVWRLGAIYNSPSLSTNIDWRAQLWRTCSQLLGNMHPLFVFYSIRVKWTDPGKQFILIRELYKKKEDYFLRTTRRRLARRDDGFIRTVFLWNI